MSSHYIADLAFQFYQSCVNPRKLECENVVGYTGNDTISGKQGVGACFIPVAGATAKLGDIKITGYEGEYSANEIYCSKLDSIGATAGDLMFWLELEEFDDGSTVWPAQYGWWSMDGATEFNDVEVKPGEGIWLTMPNDTYKVQTAGQVLAESLPVSLSTGKQLCPNPTPSTFKLGQCWITGYEGEYSANEIYCSKLDNIGATAGDIMFWLELEEFDDGSTVWPAQYGWWSMDGATEYNETVELAPGEAIWLTVPSDGYTLNWTNPLEK